MRIEGKVGLYALLSGVMWVSSLTINGYREDCSFVLGGFRPGALLGVPYLEINKCLYLEGRWLYFSSIRVHSLFFFPLPGNLGFGQISSLTNISHATWDSYDGDTLMYLCSCLFPERSVQWWFGPLPVLFPLGDSSMSGNSSLPPWNFPLDPRSWLWPQRRMWLQHWILELGRSVSELCRGLAGDGMAACSGSRMPCGLWRPRGWFPTWGQVGQRLHLLLDPDRFILFFLFFWSCRFWIFNVFL